MDRIGIKGIRASFGWRRLGLGLGLREMERIRDSMAVVLCK